MEFEFDKFVDDIEKRSINNKRRKDTNKYSLEEQELKRRREEKIRERWQNRIYWRKQWVLILTTI